MTARYIIARRAQTDLLEILEYIAEDNLLAAMEMENDFYNAFELLAENPSIGHHRKDLTNLSYRFWTVRDHYMVIYQKEDCIEILRILSSFRDISRILKS